MVFILRREFGFGAGLSGKFLKDAAQLFVFQKGIQCFRRESSGPRLASYFVEYLLQGPIFTNSEFPKPKA